jgi:4-amino-4-deoxy-L-arabinose transferase-like glycosyltransferase
MSTIKSSVLNKHRILLWILLIGLIHGLLYVFLIPPWQHYDEPGHFEYAWLIAEQGKIPESGTYDQQMRRELVTSMIEHDFYGDDQQKPNLLSDSEPIEIGYTQTGDRSLYYQLVSIPLNLISSSDFGLQLRVSRLISLILYLVSILAAYGVARTLTNQRHPLHWKLPLTLALLPGFTDLMTAVNNDVGAVAAFSIFSWLSLRMIRNGISWLNFLGVILTALI